MTTEEITKLMSEDLQAYLPNLMILAGHHLDNNPGLKQSWVDWFNGK